VELTRLKVEKAREKLAQLKLALREKRGQAKGQTLLSLRTIACNLYFSFYVTQIAILLHTNFPCFSFWYHYVSCAYLDL